MKKAIHLQATLAAEDGSSAQLTRVALQELFAQTYPQLHLTIRNVSAPDASGRVTVVVCIEGEQEARDDFAVLATNALHKVVGTLAHGTGQDDAAEPPGAVRELERMDEDSGIVLAPTIAYSGTAALPAAPAPPGLRLATRAPRRRPPRTTFHDCPAQGDGGDPDLNMNRNRTDAGDWYPVELSSVCDLPWPAEVAGTARDTWPADARAAVGHYEGIAVQVEGWLAGAQLENPDACNCHAADQVNYRLWLVEHRGQDRAQAVVCALTPRVRAYHPSWTFEAIGAVVQSGTPVRISGWLLLDPTHAEQLGRTRATPWTIQPIVVLEVRQGDEWVMLGAPPSTRGLNGGPVPTLSTPGGGPGSHTLK